MLTVLRSGLRPRFAGARPGGPGGITFSSKWATALGNSDTALTDGGAFDAVACTNTRPNTGTIIAGSEVGWTRGGNVYRLQQRGSSDCCMVQKMQAVPLSTTHFGRMWVRNEEQGNKNDHPTGYRNIGGIGPVPFSRHALNPPHTGATWQARCLNQYDWYSPTLASATWYRYEWMMEYATPTSTRIHPRIYSDAGALLYQAEDFLQEDVPSSRLDTWLASNAAALTVTAEQARAFGLGNEGPGSSTSTLGYYFFAALAFSVNNWLGDYIP